MKTAKYLRSQPSVKIIMFLLFFPLLLSGCASLVSGEQPSVVNWTTISTGQTIGQTFVANYDGLSGVSFFLSPQTKGEGNIKLHLRSGPNAADDLAVSLNEVSVENVKDPEYYGFFIPVQTSSNQKYYYAYLEIIGSGEINVGKAAGNTYLNGASYQNGTSQDAQLTFKLSYSRRKAILGLGLEAITWGGILAIGIFLFILPGWGLFSLFWLDWGKLTWPEKLGLSAGLSVAVYPLLLLWTNILGMRWGVFYAWLPPIAGLGMILWRNRKSLRLSTKIRGQLPKIKLPYKAMWSDIVFLTTLVLLIFSRLWAIRALDVPMWGDSYQHTMIAQLLVDHGGLFTSWQPYAELTTFTYHFGFHSAVAVFDWVTHMDMPKAVLWVGQLLNVLAVIALYPLATKVGHSRWSGVVAIFVAGLLLPMPMFYVNWGRYTQLAGQVILPVVVWVLWNLLTPGLPTDRGHTSKGMVTIACIAMGGLALTHYRILILALAFLIIFWILYARRETIRLMFVRTFWVGVGAGLMFLPWFVRVFGGRILQIFARSMTTSATQAIENDPQLMVIGNILIYLPTIIWLALPVVIGLGLWKREKGVVLISLWWIANLLVANPYWLGLPGGGIVTSFTVLIAIYIPASILLGVAAGWLHDQKIHMPILQTKVHTFLSLGMVIPLIGIGLWGSYQRQKDVQPSNYALATRPDILAARWISENTIPAARLLVNSFPAYNNYVIVGSDGGWWLPLLAHRQTTVPPINYGFERDPLPDYRKKLNALTFEIETKGLQDPDVLTQLKDRNISYVYVGQRQGEVNSGGPLFNSAQLLVDPNFRLVYHQDLVWIFQIQQPR